MRAWLAALVASARFRRLSQWFLFSFIASLIPFIIAWICTVLGDVPFDGWVMLQRGEVLLICFGLAATGVGDVLVNRQRLRRAAVRQRVETVTLYCTFCLLVVVVMTAVSYTCLLMGAANKYQPGHVLIACWSMGLLLMTTLSASIAASLD